VVRQRQPAGGGLLRGPGDTTGPRVAARGLHLGGHGADPILGVGHGFVAAAGRQRRAARASPSAS
jgi:hypothetical protein